MSASEIDIKELKTLIKRKYSKNWEWRSTTRLATSKNYVLEIWLGSGKKQKQVKIFATIDNDLWTAIVDYRGNLGGRSNPNESREKAVDEAVKLWWDEIKSTAA